MSEYKREEEGRKQGGSERRPKREGWFHLHFARHLKGGALASTLLLEQEGVFLQFLGR